MEKKEYRKVHKKENKKNYILMNISSISLIISMIFSVALILVGIFSTIKLSLFAALIVIDLLILVAGVLAEYFSEKRFDKDYTNYKVENTVVARKIEVAPRKPKTVSKTTNVKKETKTNKKSAKKTTANKTVVKSQNKSTTAKNKSTKKEAKKTVKKQTTKKA